MNCGFGIFNGTRPGEEVLADEGFSVELAKIDLELVLLFLAELFVGVVCSNIRVILVDLGDVDGRSGRQ